MESVRKDFLSKSDCKALRGISILCIVAHNYCHWLPGVVQENEFQWKLSNVQSLVDSLSEVSGLVYNLFSFFGHYGVSVFLFLSAYGLEKKYDNCAAQGFVWRHYSKLWKMMFPGLLMAYALNVWAIGMQHRFSVVELGAMLVLAGNLMPDPSASIWPGPYWFFGVMLQLYVVYLLIIHRRPLGLVLLIIVVCACGQMFLSPDGDLLRWYRYNLFGSMLPFGVGVVFERSESAKTRLLSGSRVLLGCVVAFAILIVMSSACFVTWTFTPMFACLFAVSLLKLLPHWLCGMFERLGGLSVALFVWHPIVRSIVIMQDMDQDVGFLMYLLSSICVAMLVTCKFNSGSGSRVGHGGSGNVCICESGSKPQ